MPIQRVVSLMLNSHERVVAETTWPDYHTSYPGSVYAASQELYKGSVYGAFLLLPEKNRKNGPDETRSDTFMGIIRAGG